jgi:hypothetical protein
MSPVAHQPITHGTRPGSLSNSPAGPAPNERATDDLRGAAAVEASALFSSELDRYREAWRQTLQTIKDTLADLERSCDAGIILPPAEPTSAVADFVDRLVSVATAASEATQQQIQADAKAEVAKAQAVLTQAQAELTTLAHQLRTANETLDMERTARVRAETAFEEARVGRNEIVSAFESQIHTLRAELERQKAEHARMMQQHVEMEKTRRAKLLAAIQGAIDTSETGGPAAKSPAPRETSLESAFESESAERQPSATTRSFASTRSLKLVAESDASDEKDKSELVRFARELLDAAEALYWADHASRRPVPDIVVRLTVNLREARELFARRVGAANVAEATVFEEQLTKMLNTSDVRFSRHLGIAAGEASGIPAGSTDERRTRT